MIKNILNLGDASIYYDFGEQINKETNKKVISFFNSLKKANLEEIINLTPSYNKLIVSFDLKKTMGIKITKKESFDINNRRDLLYANQFLNKKN